MKIIFTFLFLTIAVSCASKKAEDQASSHTLVAEQKMILVDQENQETILKKGDRFSLKRPVLAQSKGFVDALIVPSSKVSTTRLKLKPIESWTSEKMDQQLALRISDLLQKTNKVQLLMGANQFGAALSQLQELLIENPHVSYLKVLQVSCLKAMGDYQKADEIEKNIQEAEI